MQNFVRDHGSSQSQNLYPQQTAKGRVRVRAVVDHPSRTSGCRVELNSALRKMPDCSGPQNRPQEFDGGPRPCFGHTRRLASAAWLPDATGRTVPFQDQPVLAGGRSFAARVCFVKVFNMAVRRTDRSWVWSFPWRNPPVQQIPNQQISQRNISTALPTAVTSWKPATTASAARQG